MYIEEHTHNQVGKINSAEKTVLIDKVFFLKINLGKN